MKSDRYLWLRPSLDVSSGDGTLYLIDITGAVVEIEDPIGLACELLLSLDGNIQESTACKNPYFPLLKPILESREWLLSMNEPLDQLVHSYPHLSREISYFGHLYPNLVDVHFRKLSQKKVLIVGVGGIGSSIAFSLCASGIGKLTLVDPDVVNHSNLNRQFLYSDTDVGDYKVEVLSRELTKRFPATNVESINSDFDNVDLAAQLISETDLVVICGESSIVYDYPKLCDGTALMLCGYRGTDGVVGPLIDTLKGTACWGCVMEYHSRESISSLLEFRRDRRSSWNPSGFSINSSTGSIGSSVCISYLADQPDCVEHLGVLRTISMSKLSIVSESITPNSCRHTTMCNVGSGK